MDNFTYNYLNSGSAPSSRLGHVSDAILASANTDDIESQNPNNYGYDKQRSQKPLVIQIPGRPSG